MVYSADGPPAAGSLQKLGDDWTVRLGGDTPCLVAGTDLVALRRQNVPLPPRPLRDTIILSNGDCLVLAPDTALTLMEERLHLRWAFSPLELKVPAAAVTMLWLVPPANADEPGLLCHQLATGRRQRDVVLLRSGDRLEGTVKELSPARGCRVTKEGQAATVPWPNLAAVAFNTEYQARLRPRGPYPHLVLRNGSRLSLATLRLEASSARLVGKTFFGANLEIPLDELVALNLRQGRAVYLSELTPLKYEHTPFLGVSWSLGVDRSVAGHPLRLANSTYDKGLGMHAQSRVTYELAGRYRWFEALAGLDEQTGQRGRARLQVLVDGKEQGLGLAGELSGRDRPLPIRIDVRQARQLTLAVLFGSLGDVQAHVNWAEARLLK